MTTTMTQWTDRLVGRLRDTWRSYQQDQRIRRAFKGMRISDYANGNYTPLTPERAKFVERIARQAMSEFLAKNK